MLLMSSSLLFGTYLRDDALESVYDDITDLTWQDNSVVASKKRKWSAAVDDCENLDFAGVQDWRLPDIYELYSIVDLNAYDPAITLAFFHNTASYHYWSSHVDVNNPSNVWAVDFKQGNVKSYATGNNYRNVRCVRSGRINEAPVASDNSYVAGEDTSISGNVITNGIPDVDADGDTLQISSHSNPEHGILNLDSNGNFTYTPNTNYSGIESFSYTVSDGKGGEDSATVHIAVGAVNDIPVISEGESVSVVMSEEGMPTSFILALSATDNDGDILTWRIKTNASNGTATASGVGIFKAIGYTPNANYNGTDSFIVEVSDGNGADEVTVMVTIESINDVPTAIDDSVSTYENSPVSIDVLSNDGDIDGDVLMITTHSSPVHGSAVASADSITYIPYTNFIGSDSFTYIVDDGNGATVQATVNVTVWPMDNDGANEPSGVDGNHNGIEDRFENHVATLFNGTTAITLTTDETVPLSNLSTSGGSKNVSLDNAEMVILPYGTVSFTASGVGNGGLVNISLYYPYDTRISGYAKEFNDGTWHDVGAIVTHNATDNYTKVSFSIVDGSAFDLDGLINGEVKDPGGAYYRVLLEPLAVAVPLSMEAKVLLVLLLMLSASLMIRQRSEGLNILKP